MGSSYQAFCLKCGHEFQVDIGGGFRFHLLRCNICGREKNVGFNKIGEPHLRYLKGLPGPYCVATRVYDEHIKESYPGEPLSKKEYEKIVESIAGKCICGGQFLFLASPRCPECKSSDIKMGDCVMDYD